VVPENTIIPPPQRVIGNIERELVLEGQNFSRKV